MGIAAVVDQAVRAAAIPIIGVSIGHPDDRATWTVHYAPEASPAQQADGAAIVQSVDVSPAAIATAQTDAGAIADADSRLVRATVEWTLRRLLGRTPTAQERQTARTEWIAIWKALS